MALNSAAAVLKKGGVVICPTDTVYGFLADAGNKKAVEKIYKIKQRQRSKTLPIFVRDIKMAKEIAEINERQKKILRKHWPGKYTFILNKNKKKNIEDGPLYFCGGERVERCSLPLFGVNGKTIALRIPKYKFLNDLLKKVNRPLAQTSVNISGEPPLTKIEDIKARFAKNCGRSGVALFLIDGRDLKKAKPSKIIDLSRGGLTRIR